MDEWWHIANLVELRKQGIEIRPIRGGVHVKDLPDGRCVDVLRMGYNHRLVRTTSPDHVLYDRGWCYAGTGVETYLLAVGQALTWDGGDATEPEGWVKRALSFPGHPIAWREG
ncbi:MAG TPA: hypothetical protein VFS39_18375 [Nitrospira sp.]|nr:hypothetical protein [Nitrospira sp.]